MQPKLQQSYYSVEEYLAMEETATERSEYYNGEIFTMSGGTPNHNQIAVNIGSELNFQLKRSNYRVYIADVKLWIPQKNSFNYPDIMVIDGAPQFYENRKDVILNPLIVMEVLSDSTKDYDRGDKFAQYRTLESLQEYILVSQDCYHIEYFRKIAAHEWLFTEIDDKEQNLSLQSLNLSLALAEIYDKVDFA